LLAEALGASTEDVKRSSAQPIRLYSMGETLIHVSGWLAGVGRGLSKRACSFLILRYAARANDSW